MSMRKTPDGGSLFNHQHIITMKLHLPSGLLAALSACIIGAGNAHALSVWAAEHTITTSSSTTSYGPITYNPATGKITGVYTGDFSFVLNNTALKANTTDRTAVIYVTDNKNNNWGFNATSDGVASSDGVVYKDDLVGRWNGANWTTDTKVTQNTLAPHEDSNGKITLKATIDTSGTFLYAPGDTRPEYNMSGLKATTGNGILTLTINKDLIDSVTIHEADNASQVINVGVTNSSHTWSHEYATVARVASNGTVSYGDTAVDATLVTNARLEVTGGDNGNHTNVSAKGGDLVVGGTGQLFLQTSGTGAIKLTKNIILGSTTRPEANQDAGLQNVSLRFGNDGGTVTLGKTKTDDTDTINTENTDTIITLVEDAIICGATSNAQEVHIYGAVSGNHNLTISQGEKLNFDGGFKNIGSVTINGGSDVTINNGVTTTGNFTVKGGTDSNDPNVASNVSTVTIIGDTNIGGNLSGGYNGTGQGSQKNIINIGAGTHSINVLDASNGNHFTGTFNILEGANVTVVNTNRGMESIWLNKYENAGQITVAKGGSLTSRTKLNSDSTITIEGKGGNDEQASSRAADASTGATTAIITNHGTSDAYSIGNATVTIQNAAVTLTTNETTASDLKNKLTNVDLIHSGTGVLNVFGGNGGASDNNANTLTSLQTGSTLNILKATEASTSIASVTLNNNATVGIYTGGAASGDMGTLTTTSLEAGSGTSVAGSLTLNGGENSLLSLGSAVGISGALEFGTTGGLIGLAGDVLSGLSSSNRVNLFTGVTGFTVGGAAYTGEIDAGTIFNSPLFETQLLSNTAGASAYKVGFDGGNVYLEKMTENVPEPATATLGLLALAGLAARRRRK